MEKCRPPRRESNPGLSRDRQDTHHYTIEDADSVQITARINVSGGWACAYTRRQSSCKNWNIIYERTRRLEHQRQDGRAV